MATTIPLSDARESSAPRLIIPAPSRTRRSDGIEWYEVVPHPPSRSATVTAWTKDRVKAAIWQTVWLEDGTFRSEVLEKDVRTTMTVSGGRDDSGEVRIQATVADVKFEIAGRPEDEGSCRSTGRLDTLDEPVRASLQRWARIADGLYSVAEATRLTHGYGCAGCVIIGVAVTVGALCCGAGGLGCCVGAVVGFGVIIGQCGGSCASGIEDPVKIEL